MTPLPRLLVVTDAAQAASTGRDLRDVLVRATEAGALGVVVRDRHLPPEERRDLVYWVEALLAETGGVLVVASPAVEPGQNVHLTRASRHPTSAPRSWVVAATTSPSCRRRPTRAVTTPRCHPSF